MVATELHTAEIPELYKRFASLVGDRYWRRRVAQLRAEARGSRFLGKHLHDENAIAFQLERYRELTESYGQVPLSECNRRELYPAASFAAQVVSIVDATPTDHGARLIRRVQGALGNPDDMRAIRLELATATHFARRGSTLEWPEMDGRGGFDLLVETLGAPALEVECKSVSDDKGRKVHRRDALEFYDRLWKRISPIVPRLTKGLSVVVTVPERLPTRYADRESLAEHVGRQILMGCSSKLANGTEIRIAEFDPARLAHIAAETRPEILRAAVEDVTATHDRNAMVVGTRSGGVLAIAVQSAKDDAPFVALFKTLGDASRRQLSGARPALLVAGFDDLDAADLHSIAAEEAVPGSAPTALRVEVSRFLTGERRDHVVGVAFFSEDAMRPEAHALVRSGGFVYHFSKRESPQWHDGFDNLFSLS